jgi:hypothetical protein
LEKSFKKLKNNASELSLEPTRPHPYATSRQKWECPLCLSIWIAGRPDFD